MIETLLAASAFLVPLVVGVVQLIKEAGLPSKYAGVLSVLIGIGAEFLVVGTVVASPSVGITTLLGVIVGLAASGLWSGTKAVILYK